jgi:hypothetical protein
VPGFATSERWSDERGFIADTVIRSGMPVSRFRARVVRERGDALDIDLPHLSLPLVESEADGVVRLSFAGFPLAAGP